MLNDIKKIFLFAFSLLIFSCGNNTDDSKTRETIDATFKNIDSIKKVENEVVKIKPLPNNLGYEVSLIDAETFSNAVDKGIKFVADTSDFKKVGNALTLYHNSIKVQEFIDSPGGRSMPAPSHESMDNLEFYGKGYYMVNDEKWYFAIAGLYEGASYILIPPPYKNTYSISSQKALINPSGTYLLDLFFTGLYEFHGDWDLYSISDKKLKKLSSHKLACKAANRDQMYNAIESVLCPDIEEAKWISDRELLLKVNNYEGGGQSKIGYLRLTIK